MLVSQEHLVLNEATYSGVLLSHLSTRPKYNGSYLGQCCNTVSVIDEHCGLQLFKKTFIFSRFLLLFNKSDLIENRA